MLRDKTPCYVFNSGKFTFNVSLLKSAFRKVYTNYVVGYSYKTNNSVDVCKAASSLGCYSEVVSPSEYALARQNGVPYNRIIYNGVIPDTEGKFYCSLNGGIVNIDNLSELISINRYAQTHGTVVCLGIRIFFPLSITDQSKFGFEYNGGEYKELLKMISSNQLKNVHIVGIHSHISNHRNIKDWKFKASRMISIAKELEDGGYANIRYIDLGGNMYGNMHPSLLKQFSNVPTLTEYGHAIGSLMAEAYPNNEVTLITENGTSSIGDCVYIKATIIGEKTICGRRKFIANTSIYDCGFLPKTKSIPYQVENQEDNDRQILDCDIIGYACTEEDYLVRGYHGPIAVGDTIKLFNLGAYALSVAPDFIEPKHKLVVE